MPRVFESIPTLDDARSQILAEAEAGEPVAVCLGEALGLTLAEPVVADVDHPPTDRATRPGYAVRSAEAALGAWLRVADGPAGDGAEPGEAVRVLAGDPFPDGLDAVVRRSDVRADPETGPARVIELARAAVPGRGRVGRGAFIRAGDPLVPEGTVVVPAMLALLASQGAVHPLCHRRVRVAVVAVGDDLIGPSEEPSLHRERNVAGPAIVGLIQQLAAAPHDLQAVPESRALAALERATLAPVVVVLGRPSAALRRALEAVGVEPAQRGVLLRPGGRSRYGVIRDGSGRPAHHVFHLPAAPLAAVAAFTLLVRPLIDRLQGRAEDSDGSTPAAWDGPRPATGRRAEAVPVRLEVGPDARVRAIPVRPRGLDDLPALARADGLAVFPPQAGPWHGGEVVPVVRFASAG